MSTTPTVPGAGQDPAALEAARIERNRQWIASQGDPTAQPAAPAPAPAPAAAPAAPAPAPAPAPVAAPAPATPAPAAPLTPPNSQQPLASNASPGYINDDADRLDRAFQQTFGGDARKVVKSYLELQSSSAQAQQVLSQLNALGERDPNYKVVINAMMQGKPIGELRNLLGGPTEPAKPAGQSSQTPVGPTGQSDSVERLLASEGLLDVSQKSYKTPAEWQLMVSDALAERTAKKSLERTNALYQEQLVQQTQQQTAQENQRRYTQSFERTVIDTGLDFAGKDNALFSEIQRAVVAYRDPENLDLIAPDAFYKATVDVMRRKNMQIPQSVIQQISAPVAPARQPAPPSLGYPSATPQVPQTPLTAADVANQRRVEQFNKRQQQMGLRKF